MIGNESNIPCIERRLLSVAALFILSFNVMISPFSFNYLKIKQHKKIVVTINIEIAKLSRLENLNAVNYLGKAINIKIKENIDIHTVFPVNESSRISGTFSLPNKSMSKLGIVVLKRHK